MSTVAGNWKHDNVYMPNSLEKNKIKQLPDIKMTSEMSYIT